MNLEIYVKGYGFSSFAKNMGRHLSNRYGQKLLNGATKYTTDAIKTVSKREIQKTTSYLIFNKIPDKTKSLFQKSPKELLWQNKDEIEIPKERYISPEKRQQITVELS